MASSCSCDYEQPVAHNLKDNMPPNQANQPEEKYATDAPFRSYQHDLLELLFVDVIQYPGGGSDVSLEFDAEPELKVVNGKVFMYVGDREDYELKKLSNIKTNDRVFSATGDIDLSHEVKRLYKAFSTALHNKLFRLKGPFECANNFIRSALADGDPAFESLPKVKANIWFPYVCRSSSPLRGNVTYSEDLPPADEQPDSHKLVTVVNVKESGPRLRDSVDSGGIVYLGGDHGQEHLPLADSDKREERGKKRSKYVEYIYHRDFAEPGGDVCCDVRISSPFPQTWRGEETGLNVGLAKLRNGHFLYWGTPYQPGQGLQLSKLRLEEVPRMPFNLRNKFKSWLPDKEDKTTLGSIYEGAWVMRGDRLVQSVYEREYPEGVLERLRGGFFREQNEEVCTQVSRIANLIDKAMGSFERLGPKMFGFQETDEGVIQCDIGSLATYLRLPAEVLMAFIPQFSSSWRYFCGTVSFLGRKEMTGKLEIRKPLPVGGWMRGSVQDTGAGLLYVEPSEKYYSIETRAGVSWVSEYTGPGIGEGRDLNLAPLIAAAPSMMEKS